MKNNWFDVDKNGLGKLIEQHGKGRLIAELLQNALDEQVSTVTIRLDLVPGRPLAELSVEDDSPDGFRHLAHAYTLFAESYKKGDPGKRGRFNLGEKLVLALCRSAAIATTTGTVVFDEGGKRRVKTRERRPRGSEFRATLRMTRPEHEEATAYLRSVLIPAGVSVTFNGQVLRPRQPMHAFEASLPTELADAEGVLRACTRNARVEVYEAGVGEVAGLYELGLPVVETGDRWHVNVCQKVPLNLNRDNVRPAYLRRVRTVVFNELHHRLAAEDANTTWVQEATSDSECSHEGIKTYLDLRFGRDRASYDPTDPEANKRAVTQGLTVVTGGMLNKDQWRKARETGAIEPAGRICPSPKPYSDDPAAPPEDVVPPDEWTDAVRNVAGYATFLARELMGVALTVKVTRIPNNFLACYGTGLLTFNLLRLGQAWFEQGPSEAVDRLLIHEFGHQLSGDHLSDDYHEALCYLGARLKRIAVERPESFRAFAK